MDRNGYVLISGLGRSGTNWLLDLLNQSPRTHCRNEPHGCRGSVLSGLPRGEVPRSELEESLDSTWDGAIERAARSFGERDHLMRVYKDHLSWPLQRMGVVRMVTGQRFRRSLGKVMPSLRGGEWPIPSWIESRRRGHRALPIFKLEKVPGWVIWALQNRPEARILHLVRHPGGYLHSYMKRFFQGDSDFYGDRVNPGGFLDTHIGRWLDGNAGSWAVRADPRRRFPADLGEIERVNRELLDRVAAHNPAWAGRFGDTRSASLLKAELLYWRYCAEAIHQAGAANPRYRLVIYDDLARDPVGGSRAIYRDCGLDWNDATERAIRKLSGDSSVFASEWKSRLNPEQKELVESVLDGSPMRTWWT